MRGHVRQRGKNGHWYAVLDIHDPVTGTRRRKWISLPDCKGRRQAQVRCAELISELQKGTQVDSGRIRVAAFFDRWLEHLQGQVPSRSRERYTELAQKNLAPLLGALTLSKVQPAHISQAYAKALTSGRRDGK